MRRLAALSIIWLGPHVALALVRYGFGRREVGEPFAWILPLAGLQLIATAGVFVSRRVGQVLLAGAGLVYVVYFLGIIPGFVAASSVLPLACIAAIMALSMWLPFAAGQLSLAQAGFMAVGAYGSAWLTTKQEWPFLPALVLGALATALVGLAVSYPALRLRGIYLAVATLGFGEVIKVFFLNFEPTGAAFGFPGIPKLTRTWHLLVAIALIIVVLRLLMRSRVGRAIHALKSDEIAAAAHGIEMTRFRVLSFTIGAFLAGAAGGFYAHFTTFIEPENFSLGSLVDWLAMMIFGGHQVFLGAIMGAFLLVTLPELLRFLADYRLMIDGVILVVLLVVRPDGMVSGELIASRRPRLGRVSLVRPATSASVVPSGEGALLRIDSVAKSFGGLTVVAGVNFEINRGQLVGLIGPNGAGKTTLFNLITGIYTVDAGTIRFAGEPIEKLAPAAIASRGIARTFQTIRLFREMSVLENVLLGQHVRTRAGVVRCAFGFDRQEERASVARAMAVLDLVGIVRLADVRADTLPYGDQRRLEIARALAGAPCLLLLDEPSAGMNTAETEWLGELIQRVTRELNITVLLIEHDLRLLMNICERVVVLNFGRKIAEGTPREVQGDSAVIEAYLGGESDVHGPRPLASWPET